MCVIYLAPLVARIWHSLALEGRWTFGLLNSRLISILTASSAIGWLDFSVLVMYWLPTGLEPRRPHRSSFTRLYVCAVGLCQISTVKATIGCMLSCLGSQQMAVVHKHHIISYSCRHSYSPQCLDCFYGYHLQ